MEKKIHNLQELEAEAERLVATLAPQENATLVTLSGELGAGKTSFTQALARALNVQDSVTSPTFVLEKIYDLPSSSSFRHLVHIDAYRLEKGTHLSALNFDSLFREKTNLIVLEWPERVADALPRASISLTITALPDGERLFTYG
ncbi:MAG: tRNA (adenosine(37)-N6)-threonylcarbamoyltransferase complex ATPase subunit type 1 TsaE [Patescibacteria group bacterium]